MEEFVKLQVNESRLSAELRMLATFSSAEPAAEGTAVTRVVFSDDDRRARAWLQARVAEAGFTSRVDAIGNTFIRWAGSDPSLPAVGTGSHIDAIPHAGMYDGTVGVLGGLEAMRTLREAGFTPIRSIELILFTSEEPTRFGIGCLGSRVLCEALSPASAEALHDSTGATLAEVRTAAGFKGDLATVPIANGTYSAWVELHIEQGPLLEREGTPIGIVTSIAAPAGYRFSITGFGGHAGALLMPDRRDALCAASELILSIERHTRAAGPDTVATVGTCEVYPGAVNSVPSRVELQLDIRDIDPVRRDGVMHAIRNECDLLRQNRGVEIRESLVNADTPATCSPELIAIIEKVCGTRGIRYRHMISRAYHDSLFMARIGPVAMIFIPCRLGISHRPDEYSHDFSIGCGATILTETLAQLAAE